VISVLTEPFGRLRKRTKMTEEQVTPSLLRETFAVRYLQVGGEPEALRAMLGLTGMESVKRYEQISTQKIEDESQQEPAEPHQFKVMAVPQKSKQRRRRSSSAATRNHQQPGTDRTHHRGKKKTASDQKRTHEQACSGGYDKTRESYPLVRFLVTQCSPLSS